MQVAWSLQVVARIAQRYFKDKNDKILYSEGTRIKNPCENIHKENI